MRRSSPESASCGIAELVARDGPRSLDFFIGAHAAVAGMSVLTRDPSSSATSLPNLTLITP